MVLVDLHDRFLLLARIIAIALLQRLQLRMQALHLEAGSHRTLLERPERDTDDDAEQHQYPAVVQLRRPLDPEQYAQHDDGERLHETAHESTVRINLIEIAAEFLLLFV